MSTWNQITQTHCLRSKDKCANAFQNKSGKQIIKGGLFGEQEAFYLDFQAAILWLFQRRAEQTIEEQNKNC